MKKKKQTGDMRDVETAWMESRCGGMEDFSCRETCLRCVISGTGSSSVKSKYHLQAKKLNN
jgi:hypothetical protein